MSKELQEQLVMLGSVHHSLEGLLATCGYQSMTPNRIIEIFVEHTMPDRAPGVRLCPGYGGAHVWAWADNRPADHGDLGLW